LLDLHNFNFYTIFLQVGTKVKNQKEILGKQIH